MEREEQNKIHLHLATAWCKCFGACKYIYHIYTPNY
jgi:hypothetical protein